MQCFIVKHNLDRTIFRLSSKNELPINPEKEFIIIKISNRRRIIRIDSCVHIEILFVSYVCEVKEKCVSFFFYYECLNVDNMAIIEKIVVNIKKNKFSLLLSDFLSFFFFFFYSIFVLLHFYTAGCLWRSFLWLYYLVKQQPSLSSLLLLCEKMNFNEAELKKIFEKPKKVTNYLHSFRQFFIISMKKKTLFDRR